MHKESKVAEIDERIAKIESLVGSSSGNGFDDLVRLTLSDMSTWKLILLHISLPVLSHHLWWDHFPSSSNKSPFFHNQDILIRSKGSWRLWLAHLIDWMSSNQVARMHHTYTVAFLTPHPLQWQQQQQQQQIIVTIRMVMDYRVTQRKK